MDYRIAETSFGQIIFHGRDTGRPVILIITGAFAGIENADYVQDRFPEADIWRAFLPGNHAPALSEISVEAFAAAFSQAVAETVGGRDLVVVGLSVGALVAAAMDQRPIRRLVLVEPVLNPSVCWPLLAFRHDMPEGGEAFVWEIFGIGLHGRDERRDYRALLDRQAVPALALVGGEPLLPRRPVPAFPSLVDDESRARLAAHPLIELQVVPGVGHNIVHGAQEAFVAALKA